MKKFTVVSALLAFILSFAHVPAHADLPVIDETAIAQLAMQMDQWEKQLRKLEGSDLLDFNQRVTALQAVRNQITQMMNDYANIESSWDETFQDYSQWSGHTGQDYVNDMKTVLTQTDTLIKQALMSQGIASDSCNDMDQLDRLLALSQGSVGPLQAQQVTNQIIALQTQQMMKLMQIMSMNNQAQLQYMKSRTQDADRTMSLTMELHKRGNTTENSTANSGVNPNRNYNNQNDDSESED